MWRTIGHDKAVNTLTRAVLGGRLSHAYLLVGPRHVGKMSLAVDLAEAVNCLGVKKPCGECSQCKRITEGLHADVQVMAPEAQPNEDGRRRVNISIDQVRQVQRDARLKPFEGACRVIIIDGAESLSEEAANSLLKILEEPPDGVILVLLATDASSVLPTITSRCKLLELRPSPLSLVAGELRTRFGVGDEKAEEVARLSGGRLGWAVQAMEAPDLLEWHTERMAAIEGTLHGGLEARFAYAAYLASAFGENRDPARVELELWQGWWRDAMVIKAGGPEFVSNISRTEELTAVAASLSLTQIVEAVNMVREASEQLERNANARLALENLMLSLPRISALPAG